MSLRVVRRTERAETPWKNGGGVTSEIACGSGSPPAWRVSLATIDRDGPFSDFAGYDRTIVPVEGAGFELRFDDGESVVLDTLYRPFRFAGERALHCRLLGGRSRDLNAMTLRARYAHEMRTLALGAKPVPMKARATTILFACGAAYCTVDLRAVELLDGDALICEGAAHLDLTAASPASTAIAIEITPRA